MVLSLFPSASACGCSFPRPKGRSDLYNLKLGTLIELRRSTAEIDELYERKVPAWRWANTITTVEEEMQAALGVRPVGKVVDSEPM